jgi:hypothetical protein
MYLSQYLSTGSNVLFFCVNIVRRVYSGDHQFVCHKSSNLRSNRSDQVYNVQNKHSRYPPRSKNISHSFRTIFHSSSNKWFDQQYTNTHILYTNQISFDFSPSVHDEFIFSYKHQQQYNRCSLASFFFLAYVWIYI